MGLVPLQILCELSGDTPPFHSPPLNYSRNQEELLHAGQQKYIDASCFEMLPRPYSVEQKLADALKLQFDMHDHKTIGKQPTPRIREVPRSLPEPTFSDEEEYRMKENH